MPRETSSPNDESICSPDLAAVALLAAASVALLVSWLVDPWWIGSALAPVALAGFVLREADPKDRTIGLAAAAAWTVALAARLASDRAVVASTLVHLEIGLTVAVGIGGTLLAWLILRFLRRSGPTRLPAPQIAAALFWLGAVLRWLEIDAVFDHGDLALYRLVLRHDLGQVVWTIAATTLLLHLIYDRIAARLVRLTPRLRKVVAVVVVGLALSTHVLFAIGSVAATTARGRPAIGIGVHADDVDEVGSGFDAVHLEVPWSTVQPDAGVWNWSRSDAQLEEAEERDLDVLLLVGLYPPKWMTRMHDDAVMVDQWGEPFHWTDEAPGDPVDRIYDLSYADPAVNRLRERFVARVVDRYADRSPVVAVSVMNEPGYPSDLNLFRLASYDASTVDAFRDHLRSRYPSIDTMNEAFGTSFPGFEDVEPPHSLDGRFGTAWQRFREQTIVDVVDHMTGVAREHTDKPVTVKIIGHYLARFAMTRAALTGHVVQQLVDASDIVAVDLYPLTQQDLERTLQYYAGLADGKPIWVTEFNFAFGPNLPTMGSRTYSTLALLGGYADRVFFFTSDDHYLYGLSQYDSHPTLTAIRLYQTPMLSPDFVVIQGELVVQEVLAIPNLYMVYATASSWFGIAAVPWPVLLLLVAPMPSIERVPDRRQKFARWLTAGGIWALILLPGVVGL